MVRCGGKAANNTQHHHTNSLTHGATLVKLTNQLATEGGLDR